MAFIISALFIITGCVASTITSTETPGSVPAATTVPSTVKPTPVELTASPVPGPTDTSTPGSPSEIEPSIYISYLRMIDANNGWALVSGKDLPRASILRTLDGGSTWSDVTPPQLISISTRIDSYYFYGSLAALDDHTAWVIADSSSLYGTVWRTDDGGISWRPGNPISIYKPGPQTIINGFTSNLHMIDAQDGILQATVQGVMAHNFDTWFRTTDGGLTWKRFQLPNDCVDYVTCDHLFVDAISGFRTLPAMGSFWSSVGEIQDSQAWQIERTADGGSSWSRIELALPADLVEELFTGQGYQLSQTADFKVNIKQNFRQFNAEVVGLRMDLTVYSADDIIHPLFDKGFYFITNDDGQTWRSFVFSGDLFFLTAEIGWRFSAQSDGYLLEKTIDGGTGWSSAGSIIPEAGRLQFADDEAGWMILHKPDLTTPLMRTLDSGQTWTDITANVWESLLTNNFVAHPSGAPAPLAIEPWIARIKAGSPLLLNTIQMSDANNGWGTSLNGYIFHTSDGGRTWQDVTPLYGTVDSRHNFTAYDALHAWTVILPLAGCITDETLDDCPDYYSSNGPIWYTTDGGQTWQPGGMLPDPEGSYETRLIQIRFANETLGWAQWLSSDPNANGAVYHLFQTNDGGKSWTSLITGPYQGDAFYLDELTGFKFEDAPGWAKTLDDFMNGSAVGTLQKTLNGGKTWQVVALPDFAFNINDLGIHKEDISTALAGCFFAEIYSFGRQGIAIKVPCNIPDVADFDEYYYSPDGGQSWSNWVSSLYQLNISFPPRWDQWMQSADAFFLENGVGWRLFKPGADSAALVQSTGDGGKSWKTIKTVAWQDAQFDFVSEQEGWAIVTNGDEVALVHTTDGGQNWEEIKPIVVER